MRNFIARQFIFGEHNKYQSPIDFLKFSCDRKNNIKVI